MKLCSVFKINKRTPASVWHQWWKVYTKGFCSMKFSIASAHTHTPSPKQTKKRIILWNLENNFAYSWRRRIKTNIPNCIQQQEKHCFPKFTVAENREITGMTVAGRQRGNSYYEQKLPLVDYHGVFHVLLFGVFSKVFELKIEVKEKKPVFHIGTFNEKTEHLGFQWKLFKKQNLNKLIFPFELFWKRRSIISQAALLTMKSFRISQHCFLLCFLQLQRKKQMQRFAKH